MDIDVIIRTNNSSRTLPFVLKSIKNFKGVRSRIICIDFHSIDHTLELLPSNSKIISYPDKSYNYSKAINLALPFLTAEYTLIISSHTQITNNLSMDYSCKVLNHNAKVAAVCMSGTNPSEISEREVNISNFDGWNGVWNTCSLYRTRLLKERNFRLDVFSAEDQEWSKWVMLTKNMSIIHLDGVGRKNLNPRIGNMDKHLKEWESVAYFSFPEYLKINFIIKIFKKAFFEFKNKNFAQGFFWSRVSFRLFKAKYRKPRHESNY